MARYRVVLGEVASYEIEVEAATEDAACEKAEHTMETKGVKAFWCEVHAREIDHVSKIGPIASKPRKHK